MIISPVHGTNTTSTQKLLSLNDQKVFSTLFDAEASVSVPQSPVLTCTSLSHLPHISDTLFTSLRQQEQAVLKPLRGQSPRADEIETAILLLAGLTEANPNFASAYLNRAQALRMLAGSLSEQEVLADLDKAILVASPFFPGGAMSLHQRDVLAAAHTHKGLLFMKQAQLPIGTSMIHSLQKLDKDAIEEMANGEFVLGARYGSEFAARMSVKTNPYAKLCGAIVKEALKKEMDKNSSRSKVGMLESAQ